MFRSEMADKYSSFRELRRYHTENVDYKISLRELDSDLCVFSPHGGGIEPGVSELVRAIAKDDFSWYLFEGLLRHDNWSTLHITSHRFNEPQAIAFANQHIVALAIHGERGEAAEATYLGGRNTRAKQTIGDRLRNAGFNVPAGRSPNLLGEESRNICNRCSSGKGVQLEITRKQRKRFFCGDYRKLAGRKLPTPVFEKYVTAVRAALFELDNEER